MTGVKVSQLAELVKIPLERLIEQLNKAGVPATGPDFLVNETQKQDLLRFLKRDHGEEAATIEPKKITLKRKSVSEIKVQRASGRKGTVSVVRKKRHVYVKRDLAAPETQEALAEVEAKSLQDGMQLEVPAVEVVTPEPIEAQKSLEVESLPLEVVEEVLTPAPATHANVPKNKPKTTRDAEEEERVRAKAKPKVRTENKERDWNRNQVVKSLDIVKGLDDDEIEEDPEVKKTGWRPPKAKAKSSREMPVTRSRKGGKGTIEDIQKKHGFEKPVSPVIKEVSLSETIVVAELAQKMAVKTAEVIKILMKLGVMATINQPIEQAIAALVVEELGHTPKLMKELAIEEQLQLEENGALLPRAPVVTVMGHVDHGKTSLLDYIRTTRVAAKEAGGITQHIGAYHVKTDRGEITFLDTPGHAAFSAMRSRGVQCTDLVILVVAADDGVMPQTIEAIQHAKAANVPVVVAINKIDKKEADLDKIQNELAREGLVPESWGGDVMFVPVSAKTGEGIDKLLETIILQAEMLELKAPVTGPATGVILEARLDKGRGPVASVLIQKGTLKRGDIMLAGSEYGRIRTMINELGQPLSEVGPSMPVEVVGLSGTPQAGDTFLVVRDERKAREVALIRLGKERDAKMLRQQSSNKLEGFFDRLQQGDTKTLSIVLKADVQGSLEALADALEGLSTPEIKVKIIGRGVGGINESDVSLAMASRAVLIGFNVRADATARRLSDKEAIQLRYHSIIYDVVDEVKKAMNGLLGPQFKEHIVGLVEVRDVFRSAKFGAIAGCMVIEGTIKRGLPIRVLRNNVVIYQGELESLRRFKEDVSEVKHGMECGIGVKNYNDVKPGDQIEVYQVVEISRNIG
jgi:translation initiation factor IF-2